MSPTIDPYLPILRALTEARVPYTLIGSAALKLRHPAKTAAYPLPDCDLLLHPDLRHLTNAATTALDRGWQVRCWDDPWSPSLDPRGRWYARATMNDFQIDLTFECPFLNVPATLAASEIIRGVPVASLTTVWALRLIKNPGKARAFARRYGLVIPDEAEEVAAPWIQS